MNSSAASYRTELGASATARELAGRSCSRAEVLTRLFGVSIERKRVRDNNCSSDAGGVEDPVSRRAAAAEVKAEPVDAPPPDHHRQEEEEEEEDHHHAAAEQQAWPIYRPRPMYHPLCNGGGGSGGGSAGSDQDGSNSSR